MFQLYCTVRSLRVCRVVSAWAGAAAETTQRCGVVWGAYGWCVVAAVVAGDLHWLGRDVGLEIGGVEPQLPAAGEDDEGPVAWL